VNLSRDERKKEMDLMRKLNREKREQKQNLKQLIDAAKAKGFRGYSKLKKDELINLSSPHDETNDQENLLYQKLSTVKNVCNDFYNFLFVLASKFHQLSKKY